MLRRHPVTPLLLGLLLCVLIHAASAHAGQLDAPAGPSDAASGMYTLEDLYNRFDLGTPGSKAGGFAFPSAAPGVYGHTLNELMAKAPVVDANGASAELVRQGKTYFGLSASGWGQKTGTMPDRSITGALGAYTIEAGYYASGINLLTAEPNLLAAYIAYGVSIFGVSGSNAAVVNTTIAANGATASDLLQGKTAWVNGALVTGLIATKDSFSGAEGSASFSIPDGSYSGSKTATAQDADLTAANVASGVSILGTSGALLVASGNAVASQVLDGVTFSSASAGSNATGAMTNNGAANYTPSTTNQSIAAGYHDGTGLVYGDTDLVSGNIRSGVSIFGVSGSSNVVDTTISSNVAAATTIASGKTAMANGATLTGALTTSLAVPARVAKSGQKTSYVNGDDGHLRVGAGWPSPRFTIMGDGTVRDNLTGLVWLQNALCDQFYAGDSIGINKRKWSEALTAANSLASGYCGLTDSSTAGQWRLPNIKELESLGSAEALYGFACCGDGSGNFSGVQTQYWASTSYSSDFAYYLDFTTGTVVERPKEQEVGHVSYSPNFVWAVRDDASAATSVPAPVAKTGKTTVYLSGDDASSSKGVAWPSLRFAKNSDGTVTDNLTGLIWLANANCYGRLTLANALTAAASLKSGACGLSDGSAAGEWRLPSRKELLSLVNYQYLSPTLSNTDTSAKWSSGDPFTDVQSSSYLTSSNANSLATYVDFNSGGVVSSVSSSSTFYVWFVRGGY
jgi:hypothetical protein